MKYYLRAHMNLRWRGRSTRKEYWMFVLYNVLFGLVAILIDTLLGTGFAATDFGFIYLIYCFAHVLPGIAVAIRRLHDVGRSGWWYWIALLPLAGPIWLLVLLCRPSQPGENMYGPEPVN